MGKGKILLDFIVAEDIPDMSKWEFFPKETAHGHILRKVCK